MLRLRALGPDDGQGEPLGRLVTGGLVCSDVERVARVGEPRSRVGFVLQLLRDPFRFERDPLHLFLISLLRSRISLGVFLLNEGFLPVQKLAQRTFDAWVPS